MNFIVLTALLVQAFAIPDPYKVLGIQRSATQVQIKKAFKKRSIQFHPDRNPDPKSKERFAKVVNAYQLLKNPEKKRIYDMSGEDPDKMGGMGGGSGGFGGFGGGGRNGEGFTINLGEMFGGGFGGFGGGGSGFGGFGMDIEEMMRRASQQQQRQSRGGGGQRTGNRRVFNMRF